MDDQFELDLELDQRAPKARPAGGVPDVGAPIGTVELFPLAHRLKKVRQVARTLEARRTPEGRTAAWDRACRDLMAEMKGRGVAAAERHRQLVAFRDAVAAEMNSQGRRQA